MLEENNMRYFYKLRLLLSACLFISLSCLTSCEDDDSNNVNSGKTELLSFGPTGAKHGEEIKFIGRNLNKVESIVLPGVTVLKAQFKSQSADLISLIVPEEATEGKVILKTPEGDIESKTILSFEVPVTITGMTSESRPGANITITGTKLNWVKGILFGDSKDTVTVYESQSATELVVKVPANAKTGKLTLFTGGTEPLIIETEQELKVTVPNVTALTPNPVKHGENLTLSGTDLDLVKEVIFRGVGEAKVSSFVIQTATELIVTVPDNASGGTLTLVTVNSLVEVTTTQEIALVLPTITNLSPNPVDPGATLTVTGTNLDLVKSVVFTGGAKVSTFVSKSATKLVLAVPNNALKGTLTLITNRNYEVLTNPVLDIKGDLPPLPPLPYAIYDDERKAGWDDYGWGGARVWNSTEIVRQGTFAAKKTYDGSYDAIRFHGNTAVATAGYTELTFSTFGAPGSGDKTINIVVNEVWAAPYKFKVVEGEWKTYSIKLSDLGNHATINDVLFQSEGWSGVVHFDHIGFK